MRFSLATVLSATALFGLFEATLGLAAPLEERTGSHCTCAGTWHNNTKYYCSDIRLGPVILPKKLPLSSLVAEYDRLGGLCPKEFLATWWNTTSGGYNYPTLDGFQTDVDGKPIEGQQSLPVGLLIDRFGSEYGTFLAPADAPFSQRSIPPQSLDTPAGSPTYPYNYHVYKVIKSFVVASGPIAPWFGQPGQGTQYDSPMSVMDLINAGYIERVDLDGKETRNVFEREVKEQARKRSLGML